MKHKVKRAFSDMDNKNLKDYLTIQLVLMSAADLVTRSFSNDIFLHAYRFAAANVESAEKAMKRRGLSVVPCQELVRDAFLEGNPDLSPTEAENDQREPVEVDIEEFYNPQKLKLVEGECAGAET